MANVFAIRSVTQSLARWLSNAYAADPFAGKPAFTFTVVSSSQLAEEDDTDDDAAENNRVTLYLYRVGMNPHLRTSGRILRPDMDPTPLSVDLHLLLSVWSNSPADEQTVLAWTLRALHLNPVLDASALGFDAAWGPDEIIQLIPEELTTSDMMRLWDALTPSYRISASYIARVVRIDPAGPDREYAPVVATRFQLLDPPRPPAP